MELKEVKVPRTGFLHLVTRGFKEYQDKIYQRVKELTEGMTADEIQRIDSTLLKGCYGKDGLKDGLQGLLKRQRPLTSLDIFALEGFLNFRASDLFRKDMDKYLRADHPKGLDRSIDGNWPVYQGLYFEMVIESDDLIKQGAAA